MKLRYQLLITLFFGLWQHSLLFAQYSIKQDTLMPIFIAKNVPSKSYKITDIKVIGWYQKSSEIKIIKASGLVIGERIVIPSSQTSDAIKAILSNFYVDDVSIEMVKKTNTEVTLNLIVKPISSVDSLDIRCSDCTTKEIDVMSKVASKYLNAKSIPSNKRNLDTDIREALHKNGFLNANVKVGQRILENNKSKLIVYITKGSKIQISTIKLTGVSEFNEKAILRILKNKSDTSAWVSFPFFNWKRYEFEKKTIINYLHEQGYADATFVSDTVLSDTPKKLSILMDIFEGNKYFIRNVTFIGNYEFSDVELKNELKIIKNSFYKSSKTKENIVESLSSFYGKNGFSFTKIMVSEVRIEENNVDLEISLYEGKGNRIVHSEQNIVKKPLNYLPPVVTIRSPKDNSEFSIQTTTINYTIISQNQESVTNVKFYVDGKNQAVSNRGMKNSSNAQEATLSLPNRDCKITVIAENRFGFSEPQIINLHWKGLSQEEENRLKPKLNILAIGVSKYEHSHLNLKLAAKDAEDFVVSMLPQKNLLYRDVEVRLLTNSKANKDNILDGLDWLQKETTSRDVSMLFLAGHGLNDPNNIFYFLPSNYNADALKRTGISYTDIKNTIDAMAGKVILFIDACHSGNVMGVNRRALSMNMSDLVKQLNDAQNGSVIFTSSTGRQVSEENSEWGNGAFTKALIEGLNGGADFFKKGTVSIKQLDAYIAERVNKLTKGRQAPTTIIPASIDDYPITIIK